MKVQIYIGEDKVDLFNDEKISITQKLNDIEKLSNVFSDFTNSFTVPATQNNNRIFKHYYDVDVAGDFNANLRIGGFIEIDTLPFKFGVWQLESVTVKSQHSDNYKITFYSKSVQLSKLFGDDTIDKLDFDKDGVKVWNSLSQFDYDYTETNLVKTLNDPTFLDGHVITPLIAYTNRDWNYGTTLADDITSSSYPILTDEIRSALRVIKIIEGIETKYGITFSRDLFGTEMFNKLFMWMNNSRTQAASIDYTIFPITTALTPNGAYDNDGTIFLIDNTIIATTVPIVTPIPQGEYLQISFNVFPSDLTGVYDMKIVDDLGNDLIGLGSWQKIGVTGNRNVSYIYKNLTPGPVTTKARLVISPKSTNTFRLDVYVVKKPGPYVMDIIASVKTINNFSTKAAAVVVQDSIPKMKVIDFIQGIMKMFKLIIRPTSETDFYIDTLEGYYNDGSILDVSPFIDVTDVLIERPSIYRNISFTFQPTSNVLGYKFRISNDPINRKIGYGDLRSEYPLISENNDLNVELPFENMLFERLVVSEPNVNANDITNIIIGQSCKLNEDNVTLSPNDSRPILFFNNGLSDISVHPIKYKFKSTSSVVTIDEVYNIGNTDNQITTDVTQTINWGSEIDPWHGSEMTQSLYNNFWSNWIATIYSTKQRKFKFEGYLPPRYIQELSLNDRLIIGQSRYKISDYTIDLVTGKTTFNLFNDIII